MDRERPVAPPTLRYSTLVRNIEAPDDPTRVGGLQVKGCSVIDPTCAEPNADGQDISIDNAKLLQAMFRKVPTTGFIGSLQLDALPASSGIMTSYVHFTADTPLSTDFYAQTPVLLIRAELFMLLARVSAVTLDPNATTIAVRVHDCGGRTAPGVAMASTSAPGATFVPLQSDMVPVVGGLETTEDGGALLVNVPANRPVALTFRDVHGNRVLTDSALLNPRPGAINYLFWYPRHSAQQKWMSEARRRKLVQ